LNAIWQGNNRGIEKPVMAIDLLTASLVKRTVGKVRAIRGKLGSRSG
jgi:hypothetical protein